ncbi:LysR family transcriptional regulator [Virgisporangium aliadipatigenens]|uniref:LysR family transcriptional regulator n=1 Tax=Virgisporangium aliadipatigenens TaxID=741659 RepID=A0A8J3YGE6_9ACTN|nr:LysR family transcriptional regulator [Virgisporangium aliadipatigenens]GIJ43530.1 LysR family transcriptional regulator [Virgisporangium aliadipatigenens]
MSDADVVDPHLLRTFVAVARHGSFSLAAADLGYTQSAVSQQIAALEHDLGVTLLHRRPVRPTSAGTRLLQHAAPLLLRLDAARADVRDAAEPPGSLTLGFCGPTAGPVAAALAAVRRERPDAPLALRTLPRAEILAAVAAGTLDAGLVDGVVAPTDPLPGTAALRTVPIAESPVAVAFPPGHPLAARGGVRLSDLADAVWIDSALLPDVRAAAGLDRARAVLTYPGGDSATLLALVAAGHGLTVLPATAAPQGVPVTAPRLVHRVDLVHTHAPGPLLTALINALK